MVSQINGYSNNCAVKKLHFDCVQQDSCLKIAIVTGWTNATGFTKCGRSSGAMQGNFWKNQHYICVEQGSCLKMVIITAWPKAAGSQNNCAVQGNCWINGHCNCVEQGSCLKIAVALPEYFSAALSRKEQSLTVPRVLLPSFTQRCCLQNVVQSTEGESPFWLPFIASLHYINSPKLTLSHQ